MLKNKSKNSSLDDFYIVLPFFHKGGVERWSLNIADCLETSFRSVSILCLGNITATPAEYGLSGNIKKITLTAFIKLIYSSKSKTILTALTKTNLLVSTLGLFCSSTFVISSVHLTISRKKQESFLKYAIRKVLHTFIVQFSDLTITVSKGIENELRKLGTNARIETIYNPCFNLSQINISSLPFVGSNGFVNIVSAGRLHPQKRFDTLIRGFYNSIYPLNPLSTLTIYGEGELLEELTRLINDLKIEESVFIKPFSENILKDFEKYNFFILTSEYEGFGNVLAEALCSGLNCISFNIPHGPREILKDGEFGLLIEPTIESLEFALQNILDEKFNQLAFRRNQHERVNHLKKFTSETFKSSIEIFLN